MKRNILTTIFLLILAGILPATAQLRFSDATHTPVEITPAASTGLTAVYVVYTTSGLSMTYAASSAATQVEVSTFDLRGASFATPVDQSLLSRNGAELTVATVTANSGYVFTEPNRTTYYWISDYSTGPFSISELNIDPDHDCDRVFLTTVGSAPRMVYYSINGRAIEIDREIKLSFTTMTADNDNVCFVTTQTQRNLSYIDGRFSIESPLCDTYFTITGDRFLHQWATEKQLTSGRFATQSVAVISSATQHSRNNDNELRIESAIGGSAPVDVDFKAAVTDAVVFTQWLLARDEDMEDVIYRTSDLDFSYTFTEMGNYYVRFTAADASGACETTGDTYTVYIGESALRCPNAFSPGASEGVNDIWKVSYKSIISFECYIFNRWGEKMAEFHNPADGWDGRYKGKIVPPGVYYYVIKAKGSDGKEYSLSGDINIIGSSR